MRYRLIALAFAGLHVLLPAQQQTQAVSSLTGLPLLVRTDENLKLHAQEFPAWMQNTYLKNKDLVVTPIAAERDQFGMLHTKYREYYKGNPIEGSMVITHEASGLIQSFNGDWFRDIKPLNQVSLSGDQALQKALQKVNARTYMWENKAAEQRMQQLLNDPAFTYKPLPQLVLWPVIDKAKKHVTFQYAYKMNVYASAPLYRANVFVDAETGAILHEQKLICTTDVPATANTKYSGTQNIVTDNFTAGTYRLREAGRGNGIITYNLNNASNQTNPVDFTNNTTSWASTGIDQCATDAHWGAEKTYDYYSQTYGRNSIDGNGLALISYVHYDNNFVNAFWDGNSMTYGDGDMSMGYNIFTALDVCGHEITHGLVQYTAQLSGGEADALNEGFADIFGTTIEAFARPSNHDWIMGKDVTVSGAGFRDMSNPAAMQQPDTYMGANWDPSGEPHNNNGPCIYWYYLLCNGGSGVNDNSQSYNVTSVSMLKASAIAYRALSVYMTPLTDYNNVRQYTIQAAKDLYGPCSTEMIQTTNAWYAVGVGPAYINGVIAPGFSAATPTLCTAPATVTFNNTTNSGATYTWYFGDGSTSTAYNPVHTYTANGNYTVKLVVNGCTMGTKDSLTQINYVSINPSNPCIYNMPPTSQSPVTYSACAGTLYDDGGPTMNYSGNSNSQVTIASPPGTQLALTFTSFAMENNFDYLYLYDGVGTGGTLLGSYTGALLPNNGLPISAASGTVTVVQLSDVFLEDTGFEIHWSCSAPQGISENTYSSSGVTLFPNPAGSSLTIELSDASKPNTQARYELVDALGKIVLSGSCAQGFNKIDLSGLHAGIYSCRIVHSSSESVVKRFVKE
ncbi:MAG: M4 family metallopeptidase [Bacteroidetes bacterium]|nr:M4 family metallopeptidase [Bacteroidota bacterium]